MEDFFVILDDELKKTLDFWQRKMAGLSKLHSTIPQEHFEERSWHVLAFFGTWMEFSSNSG